MIAAERDRAQRILGVIVNALPHIEVGQGVPATAGPDFDQLLAGMEIEDRISGALSAADVGLRRAAEVRGVSVVQAADALEVAVGALRLHDSLGYGDPIYEAAPRAGVLMARARAEDGSVDLNEIAPTRDQQLDVTTALLVAVVVDLCIIWNVAPSIAAERLALEIAGLPDHPV